MFIEGRLYQCISDGLSCCTSHFRSTALIVWNVPQEVVKYERQCADFEMDLKDLYYSSWPSIGFKLKAFYFLINALLIASVLLIASYNINKFQKHHYLARGGCIRLQYAACSKLCAFSNVQSRYGTYRPIQCAFYSVKYLLCSLYCAVHIYFLANRARNYNYYDEIFPC